MHLKIGPCAFQQDCESAKPSEWLMLFWPNTIHPLTMASRIIEPHRALLVLVKTEFIYFHVCLNITQETTFKLNDWRNIFPNLPS